MQPERTDNVRVQCSYNDLLQSSDEVNPPDAGGCQRLLLCLTPFLGDLHRIRTDEMPLRPDSCSCLNSLDTRLSIGCKLNIIPSLLRRGGGLRSLLDISSSAGRRLDGRYLLLGLALRERVLCKEAHGIFEA